MVMKGMAVGLDNFGLNNFDSISDKKFDRRLYDEYIQDVRHKTIEVKMHSKYGGEALKI